MLPMEYTKIRYILANTCLIISHLLTNYLLFLNQSLLVALRKTMYNASPQKIPTTKYVPINNAVSSTITLLIRLPTCKNSIIVRTIQLPIMPIEKYFKKLPLSVLFLVFLLTLSNPTINTVNITLSNIVSRT